eukprot:CAMPEP_0184349798 /NCGR_PEP_ID=MMETSP1089-20130417/37239_1 /TAXON_ID=38269 ORGANISM="Gloeochaete wittrockiana, Strain SAG46.84" /NCGR_SAMPLE_ID=MMETSP1089 /ASSEMBLY_ACC=CAM_ASM_000445 /LENGTH=56 /DNA_ID=CAMNT_0026682261 /DNA_START=1511 /DNA_END=1678 /DNA_ORIENTATION=+
MNAIDEDDVVLGCNKVKLRVGDEEVEGHGVGVGVMGGISSKDVGVGGDGTSKDEVG